VPGYRQNPSATKPPLCDETLFKVSYLRFTVNVEIETDRSIVHDVFCVITLHKSHDIIKILQFNENTLNTSSGDYTAISNSPSAYEVTVYDIFLCRHTVQI